MKTIIIFIILLMATPILADDWYVRPADYAVGNDDGSSYINAWQGLGSVIWGGEAGIEAGDTLWVCGTHIRDETNQYGVLNYTITPTSGTSGNEVTIRGDYPGDPGYIYGWKQKGSAWTDLGGGLFSIGIIASCFNDFVLENPSGATHTLLTRIDNTTGTLTGDWVFTNGITTVTEDGVDGGNAATILDSGDYVSFSTSGGVFYEVDGEPGSENTFEITVVYAGATATDATDSTITVDTSAHTAAVAAASSSYWVVSYASGKTLYVHCTNDGDPADQVVQNRFGYMWWLAGKEYITFKNLDIYQHYRFTHTNPSTDNYSHITWDGCKLFYGCDISGTIVMTRGGHYNVVQNCEIAYSINGIYTYHRDDSGGSDVEVSNCLLKDNIIHDMGNRPATYGADAHGIGFQSGADNIVESNTIYNCGSGITLYAGEYNTMTGYIVRYNKVYDTHSDGTANSRGIETAISNNNVADVSGNQFYCNVVFNCGTGLRSQFHDEVTWYNNTIYNCTKGFESTRNNGGVGANVKLRNNVFLENTDHIYWGSGATSYTCDSNYNSFYPVVGDIFYHSYAAGGANCTWAEWKAISVAGSTFDTPNSIDTDPELVGAARRKLPPKPGSPIIGAGEDMSLPQDYRGNPISTDMGAIAYTQYVIF